MDIRKADGGTRLFIERSATFAVCLLLLILRRPSTITHAQFWAEDGTIFYRDALVLGWKSLLQPYAGYSHLCVRIVALLASHLNARHAPLCLNLAALLLAAFCCSEFAHARYRFLLESDILRSVLCLAMAAAFPSYELVGNMANLQWFILVAAIPMALYSEPSGPGSRLILFALGLFIALTVPALLVILPIIYWPSRIRRLSALSIGITAGLFLQLSIFFRGGQNVPTRVGQVAGTVKTTLIALSNQVILPTLIGQRHAYSVATRLGGWVSMAVAVLFTIFVVWLGISAAAKTRRYLAAAVWLMFFSVAISLATREAVRGLLPDFHHAIRFGGDRYFFCGCCVFAYCLALAFEHWHKPAKRQPFAFALFFLLSSAVNFGIGPLRDLKWGSYAAQVDEWKDARRSGRRHGEVSVPGNPEPWHIDLPGGEFGE